MNEDNNNEIVKDLPLHPKTDEIVNGSLHDHLLGTEPAPNLSNSFKAKYSLIAVDNADIHTEIISRPEKNADIDTEIIPRAYNETSKEIHINIMYRGNAEVLTEIQPIGYNNLLAEIEVPPHNRMSAIYEVQQPPIITDSFTPTQDAFTREKTEYQTINYGEYKSMLAGQSRDDIWRSFIQFDVTSINPSYVLTSAYVRMYYSGSIPKGITLELLNAGSKWSEYSITHLNRPTPIQLITKEFTINEQAGYLEFNVFDIVKSWVALHQVNNGFIIRVSNEITDGYVTFLTRESQLPPELVVEYFDSTIFSFGRSQHITEIFIYKSLPSDKDTEITVGSTFDNSEYPTYLYVHRVEVPLDEDIFVEIKVNKPYIPAELVVAIPDESNILTEVSVKVSKDRTIWSDITINKPSIPIEIIASRIKDDEHETELVINKPFIEAEITIPTHRDSDIITEIDINTIFSSNVHTEILLSKDTIPTKISSRALEDHNLYTKIAVSKPKIEAEIVVKHRDDIWVEIEPNIISDLTTEIVVSKPEVEACIAIRVQKDFDSNADIFVSYVNDINTEIIARKVSQLPTDIDIKAVSQTDTKISVSKPYIPTQITIPTWDESDILTTIKPRILTVYNIYTVIRVNGGVSGYAFIM
ncbi:DNRLRE domain-containing protein [Lysinibacillus sp. NPDC093210]|uniref:DNRLRE domain-containing protein n=1 Tax=Lysinibacillus sp. NPDC093210 TaxID=3364133 RepID=UPI00381DDC6F